MDPRSWILLLMLGFISSSLSDPPERTETVGEGMSVNISFNNAEQCVHLSTRADSNHTWSPRCMICLENGPLCPEFRNRCSVFPHGVTLHNVSKADEGIYNITPHLNGNGTATNIVHLVVRDHQPSSTQGPPNSPTSGTTRPVGTASAVTGLTASQLAGVMVIPIAILIAGVVMWLKKKSGQSQCCRRRQSSEPPASNTVVLQPLPTQPNELQVDQAMQEQDLLANGRAQEDEVSV